MKEIILEQVRKMTDSQLIYNFIDDFIYPITLFVMVFLTYHFLKRIYFVLKEKKYEKKLATSNIKDIDKMDGLQFEVYLKSLFKELGYKVIVTKSTQDFGADLLLEKGQRKIAVQAKRYGYKNNVSLDAIQQIYTSLPYYKANEAWVLTNSFFTKSAEKLGKVCNVKLLNRYELVDYINEINPSVNAKVIYEETDPEKRKCPSCGGNMVVRTSKANNRFMGCEQFPNCKHTESIAN